MAHEPLQLREAWLPKPSPPKSDKAVDIFHTPLAEMEKRADTADISVLFFSDCANFLAVYAQTN